MPSSHNKQNLRSWCYEEKYFEIWDAAMAACLPLGTISHHHGIGYYKTKYLKQELGSSYEVLKRLKAALDPKGTMNPSKLLGD